MIFWWKFCKLSTQLGSGRMVWSTQTSETSEHKESDKLLIAIVVILYILLLDLRMLTVLGKK